MSLETFEAGYAGARPPRTGSQWSGMWKLSQTTDRLIDGKWPSPWSVAGGNQTKSFAIGPGDITPQDVQFNDDGTKFYVIGQARDTIFQYTCATAWDVNTASYANKSFYVGTQDTQPTGLFFKPDGTKFYFIGETNDRIYQYSCATAWDISTALYDNKLFGLFSSFEVFPFGLFFKSDGTRFYIIGESTDRIYQFDCATAWDVSTAASSTGSFNVGPETPQPTALFFKPDGISFYVLGLSGAVFQYTCATAWDITTASYASKSFSVATQENNSRGLFFKPDGTVFYIVGSINDTVFQYSCATAWDVSTSSYGSKAFFIGGGLESAPRDVQFNDDGTKFYIIGTTNKTVYQYTCATAWDVNTASYANKSFYVNLQETQPSGLFFKSDGTKFYVIGTTNDTVYQYSCATAWDVSTASYDSKSFSVAGQDTSPEGVFFKPDGLKFYIAGNTNNTIYQYSCATAWDVSTASYDTKSFSVTAQEGGPTGLFFKSDGTLFYVIGEANDRIFQYSCATAWDVSTASYSTKSFSFAIQDLQPYGLTFKSDGTAVYIMGLTSRTVYQYSCSTAWEMNATSTYDSKSFSVAAQETNPADVQFKDDGTKFYIIGSTNDTIYQYSCATAWDVSTASYDTKSFSVAAQETAPTGLFFKPDGTKFYIVGSTNSTIYQYSCATAWDISTGSYDSKSFSAVTQEQYVYGGVFFKSDGTAFYIVGNSGRVFQYSCATAWDVSTASYDTKSFSPGTQDGQPNGLFFKSDGTKFYVSGNISDTVYQYSCAKAWDVGTAFYDGRSFSVAGQETSPNGLFFKPDGTKFYVVGPVNDTIYQYSTVAAWEIQSPFYDNKFYRLIAAEEISVAGLFFKTDGTKFYILGSQYDTIYQHSCATAWDISTAFYDSKSFNIAAQEISAAVLFFKTDGTKFYIVGTTNKTVYQYSCATAWDISTASYDSRSFSVATQETTPNGLFFKSDGLKFYVVGTTNDTVFQYACGTAWDISTAYYETKSFSVSAQEGTSQGISFKDDGTKFYIVGSTNDSAYQYSCTTAWDVSTASYDGVAYSLLTQDTTSHDIQFKSDGTTFYVLGDSTDTIYQYSCLLQ